MECVNVSPSGIGEPGGRVVLIALQGGCGACGVVAGQDLFEEVGRRGGPYRLWPDDAVGVAVPDDLQVEVVRDPAAGQHGVELLPGLFTGGEAVHGVDRESLGGVHRGGVAELGGGLNVGGRQPYPVPVAQVLDVKIAVAADGAYGPAVTVFDPVGRCQPQLAVVAAGDDQVTDTGAVPIGQRHLCVGVGRECRRVGGCGLAG